MEQEDRDRLKEIEMGIKSINLAINGDRGIITRMDNHGGRLRKIENVLLVGGAAFTAAGGVLVYAKEIVIGWAKKKMMGES